MAKYDSSATEYAAAGARVGIVAARFNQRLVDKLLEATIETLGQHGIASEDITVVRVPGAFEIPLVAQRLATAGGVEAIVALGAIVRGDTPHFDFVAHGCANGVLRVSLDRDLPVIFGVLTTDTMEQALERVGGRAGNKGAEAAHAALEMISLLRRLSV